MSRAFKAHFIGACLLGTSAARADLVPFTLDSAQSQITWTGFDFIYLGTVLPPFIAGTFEQQQPGSLVSRYSGTIVADLDIPNASIHFPGGSTADAAVFPSDLIPTPIGGEGPLDYAGRRSLSSLSIRYESLSDVIFDLTSGSMALSGSGPVYSFGTGEVFDFSSGALNVFLGGDVYPYGDFLGSTSLTAYSMTNAAGNGTLEDLGGILELTIPTSLTLNILDNQNTGIRLTFAGQLVATAVPEAGTLVLVGLGGLFALVAANRRHLGG